ncbi:MAG: hypothetical protein M1522_07750 [Actinobacteria bacterium]|nr:hypothetical protein [Actinomycetota bacterium]
MPETDTILALAIEACGEAPEGDRSSWWERVIAVATEIPQAATRIEASLRDAPIKRVELPGVIERVEELRLADGRVGRGAVTFRPDHPGKYGPVERYTTEWLTSDEGRAVFEAAKAAVGSHVTIVRERVPKYANGQRMIDADGQPATTSRIVEVRADSVEAGGSTGAPARPAPESAAPATSGPGESTVSSVWAASIRRGLAQAGIAEADFLPVLENTLGRPTAIEGVRLSEAHQVVEMVRKFNPQSQAQTEGGRR